MTGPVISKKGLATMKNKTFINLNFEEYKDKVRACWLGKNIGGTMGAPYEGKRQALDIQGFATDFGKPLRNDDLDLQFLLRIWLWSVLLILHPMKNSESNCL